MSIENERVSSGDIVARWVFSIMLLITISLFVWSYKLSVELDKMNERNVETIYDKM